MEESRELWLMTTISIIVACGSAQLIRIFINMMIRNYQSDERVRYFRIVSELVNCGISSFMLIVGTFEKSILIGKNLVFEYYVSTLVLCVIYSYLFFASSPNPMSIITDHWEYLVESEDDADLEMESLNNNLGTISSSNSSSRTDGLRRRGQDSLDSVSIETPTDEKKRKRRKPADSATVFFRLSWPSILGQFIGLHVALRYLHLIWDRWLTDHHVLKTDLLKDCLICLNTGPMQGFVIEAAITFIWATTNNWLNNIRQSSSVRFISNSFLVISFLQGVVVTTVLYMFIDITGSFGNPFLSYALERECLYDVKSVIHHIIVYVFGSLFGTVMFQVIPTSKHFPSLLLILFTLVSFYFILPGVVSKDFFFI